MGMTNNELPDRIQQVLRAEGFQPCQMDITRDIVDMVEHGWNAIEMENGLGLRLYEALRNAGIAP